MDAEAKKKILVQEYQMKMTGKCRMNSKNGCSDYPMVAKMALKEMVRQCHRRRV